MNLNLIEIVAGNDFLGRLFGISVRAKAYRQVNFRIYLLLFLLWLDLAFALATALVPTEKMGLLLQLGDLPFHVMNQNRYFMTGVVIFYRINPTVMLTFFVLDDFEWLRKANRMYANLDSPLIGKRTERLLLRCKRMLILCIVFLAAMILLAVATSAIHYRTRNSPYNLIGAYIYMALFAVVYTCLSCHFLMQLYLTVRVCTEMFELINQRFYKDLVLYKRHARFPSNLGRFSQMCFLLHNINEYIRKQYILYFVCSLPVIVILFYCAFFSNLKPLSSALFLLTLGYILFFLIFFSSIIGQVDVQAKRISDPIYKEYIINSLNKHTGIQFFQLSRYFQCVWNSTISLEIMGNPINSNTSITILTILFTIIAFMIGQHSD